MEHDTFADWWGASATSANGLSVAMEGIWERARDRAVIVESQHKTILRLRQQVQDNATAGLVLDELEEWIGHTHEYAVRDHQTTRQVVLNQTRTALMDIKAKHTTATDSDPEPSAVAAMVDLHARGEVVGREDRDVADLVTGEGKNAQLAEDWLPGLDTEVVPDDLHCQRGTPNWRQNVDTRLNFLLARARDIPALVERIEALEAKVCELREEPIA